MNIGGILKYRTGPPQRHTCNNLGMVIKENGKKGKADKNPVNNHLLFLIYFIIILAALPIFSQPATGSSKSLLGERGRITVIW